MLFDKLDAKKQANYRTSSVAAACAWAAVIVVFSDRCLCSVAWTAQAETLFHVADKTGHGEISWKQFKHLVRTPPPSLLQASSIPSKSYMQQAQGCQRSVQVAAAARAHYDNTPRFVRSASSGVK